MPIMKRTMYPPQKDSPVVFLSGNISASDTVMTVSATTTLPSVVPFPLTLGIDKTITETVIVTNVNAGTKVLTITRQTGSLAWEAGTQCSRVFNASDLLAVQQNISDTIDLINPLETSVGGYDGRITTLETTVGSSSSGLVKGLADEITRATTAENTEKTRAQNAESAIDTAKPNRTELAQLIVDWVYSQDATKVLLTISRYNANTQQTTQFTKTLPVASAIAMGVMPPETFNEITNLRSAVTALQQQGGRFINESFGTKAALESYIVPATVNVGDFCFVLDDETHGYNTTRWIYNNVKGTSTSTQTANGFGFGYIVTYDPVGIADSNTLGLVKSDVGTTNGKIFVETNGTMSLVGWDTLNTTVNGKLDKAGGTMTGNIFASNPEITIQGARNIYAGTDAMTAGTTDLTTGVIYLQYE